MSAKVCERNIAVIAAKARSTRFPGKNKALLAGKPLVVHAIEMAAQSGVFDTITVSTDDETIARLAKDAGAEVPFMRDASLTRDTVEVPAVVRHAVQWYQQNRGLQFDWVCILQPPCPLRAASDITDSRKLIDEKPEVDAVVSVSKYRHHPYWALRIEGNHIVPDMPESITKSRQNLPDLYHPDGTIYWWRVRALLSSLNVHDGTVIPYHTPADSVLDIDYPQDLQYAEWRLAKRRQAHSK